MNLYDLIDIDKFWSKVDIRDVDECWPWKDAPQSRGYGVYWIDRLRQIGAHRVSWYIANGPIPEGKFILHKCDNPICVNPNHLYCGNHSDNLMDRLERNPTPPEIIGMASARFYEGEIWLIRRLKIDLGGCSRWMYKFSAVFVGKMFNTSNRTILNIWNSDKYLCKEGYYL